MRLSLADTSISSSLFFPIVNALTSQTLQVNTHYTFFFGGEQYITDLLWARVGVDQLLDLRGEEADAGDQGGQAELEGQQAVHICCAHARACVQGE